MNRPLPPNFESIRRDYRRHLATAKMRLEQRDPIPSIEITTYISLAAQLAAIISYWRPDEVSPDIAQQLRETVNTANLFHMARAYAQGERASLERWNEVAAAGVPQLDKLRTEIAAALDAASGD